MEEKKVTRKYRVFRWFVRLFYPAPEFVGLENLPDGPAVIVANHAQMNGPLVGELYFPGRHFVWCAAEMMTLREVPGYAFGDFWSFKPRYTHVFYRLLSYLIAPLSVMVFNNAHTIPVYRDARMLSTFRQTLAELQRGARIIVFPEHNVRHNHVVYDFQEGFADVARLYYRQTGQALRFVPVYVAPRLRKTVIGKPVSFDPGAAPAPERRRICDEMMARITALAEALPPHTVVPYRNIPKKDYPRNIPSGRSSK